jgi:peptidoglycan/xylan/chitin deacetylase (PgdA/CDA1 family)
MKISAIRRLRRAAQKLRNLSAPFGVILLYHRVAESQSDPHSLCVTPQHFAEHLEVLRQQSQPMRLRQLAGALSSGERLRLAVAVTFDDGYADNLYNAKPLLERYDIPATVFVTAGYVGSSREFWWDEIDRLLLQTDTLPKEFQLKVNGNIYRWNLDDPGLRQQCHRSLTGMLRGLPDSEQRMTLNSLLDWAGAESKSRPTHRPLSPDETLRLVEGELIEIGSHTLTHPILSALSVTAQQNEIRRSKIILEEILGHPVTSFAYPHGSRSDYTAETVAIVRGAGFTCACSVLFDAIWQCTDYYQLPRVKVDDWDGDTFSRIIRWLLE